MPDSPSQRPSRRAWILGSLAIAAGVAIAVWFGLAASLGQVTWQDNRYHVRSDKLVTVTYEIRRDAGRAVVCTVEAKDVRHAVVGTTRERVPASEEQTVQVTTEVHTTNHAVMGAVRTCAYADEPARS